MQNFPKLPPVFIFLIFHNHFQVNNGNSSSNIHFCLLWILNFSFTELYEHTDRVWCILSNLVTPTQSHFPAPGFFCLLLLDPSCSQNKFEKFSLNFSAIIMPKISFGKQYCHLKTFQSGNIITKFPSYKIPKLWNLQVMKSFLLLFHFSFLVEFLLFGNSV